ncbi:hypothetical protein A5731_28680 [Mycolicibacterium conceptionense]|uniref:Uncharacterized protein n=1 Tax=Mycolicibacterium conceptionense TaxID=451644 RepID=A0A1A2V0S2_9MYCO|nr:hypothetical protein A5718_21065 [Mycolicibacterium conceptionense]OBE93429.1 hypothetical protein A5731_28680 [Mycolicibacterium conceptionense]OBF25309.1 hypothetical protein A5726_07680 [Mycolicibacterium conceptionense]OBF38881.1 hypothetical protein A5720_18795 [Mycolicibacterium conceptionense]OBH94386.1 hypothetical protein A5716_25355 [Mycolicibacterium conceptionense]
MGGGFACRSARQHPDLTPPSDLVLGRVVLALLAVDGVISAVVGALLLPSYIGSIPFPVSALAAGALNTALVWAATYWTDSMRIAALPLWTWLATVVVMTFGGPGSDLIFAGPGLMAYGSLIFIAAGALPPAAMLRRHYRR